MGDYATIDEAALDRATHQFPKLLETARDIGPKWATFTITPAFYRRIISEYHCQRNATRANAI